MTKTLLGEKIAILIANGFHEDDMTASQRALQELGANTRVVGMDNGLVNSWKGDAWGHHFAADTVLSAALAADYSMLVVPAGQRSMEKLKLTAHTRRFLNGFIDTGKPLALFGGAAELLVFAERAEGRAVSVPESIEEQMRDCGANVVDEDMTFDKNLMTGRSTDIPDFVEKMAENFVNYVSFKQAA